MDLIIDTHVLLWWDEGGARLPVRVRDALADPENRIFVSAAAVWEIAIKRRAGKLRFTKGIAATVEINGFISLPISAKDAEISGELDWDHRDPLDRILLAQCLSNNLTPVTANAKLRARSEIAQFWAG